MKVLVQAPVFTSSGYGEHSRMLMRSLFSLENKNLDLYLDPLNWGNTSWATTDEELENKCHSLGQKNAMYRENTRDNPEYDVQIHVGLPNEFTKKAPYSVLLTAGIETDRVSPEWLNAIKERGINKIIVPSEHSRSGFINTAYLLKNQESDETLECEVEVDVVPYPFRDISKEEIELNLKTDFNFLSVAMFTARKNLKNTITWFLEEFGDDDNVGLILKTGLGKSTNIDKERTFKTLKKITSQFEGHKCKIYLLHGNLSEGQMRGLYEHPNVKALVSTTHGEGFGLPMFESASYGLPVIATDWSAHTEFLKAEVSVSKKALKETKNMFCAVDCEVKQIQEEASWEKVITKESEWAYPDAEAFKSQMRKVKNNHKKHKETAAILKDAINSTYNEPKVYKKMLDSIFGEDVLSIFDLQSIKTEDIPKVSIITSVYDGDEYIDSFLKNITSQTIFEEKCELILINANSPGNEEEIILKYKEKYPNNIKYRRLEEDPGIYGTWNIALEMSTGEFITNANLDDRKSVDSIVAHAEELLRNPEIDLVYSDMLITKEINETWEENTSNGEKYTMPNFSLGALKMINMPHAAPMWRKSLHDKYGVFDASFRSAGDWEMWLRAASRGSRFKKIDGLYNLYCFNPKGVSTNPDNFSWKQEEEKEFMKNTVHKSNKIISFCLWGQDPKYVHGAVKNAELAKEIYPDWKCRFYVASSVPSTIVSILSSYDHVEVVKREPWGDWKSMFWRFEPASDPEVDVMISRDTDSRLSLREKAAVDEWLDSDCGFHIMRDHPYHKFPVLGGMWGVKKGTCTNMNSLIEEFGGTNQYGTDYVFFAEKVLPSINEDQIMVHDEFFDKKPFPTDRKNFEFVGEVYDKDENRFVEHVEILRDYLENHEP